MLETQKPKITNVQVLSENIYLHNIHTQQNRLSN